MQKDRKMNLPEVCCWTAGKHPCVARATLVEKGNESVTLCFTKRMRMSLLEDKSNMWRLDKDEVSSNFVRMRKNITSESCCKETALTMLFLPLIQVSFTWHHSAAASAYEHALLTHAGCTARSRVAPKSIKKRHSIYEVFKYVKQRLHQKLP